MISAFEILFYWIVGSTWSYIESSVWTLSFDLELYITKYISLFIIISLECKYNVVQYMDVYFIGILSY